MQLTISGLKYLGAAASALAVASCHILSASDQKTVAVVQRNLAPTTRIAQNNADTNAVPKPKTSTPEGAPPPSAALALGTIDVPEGTLFEAERGDPNMIPDVLASGGGAVKVTKAWQPLMTAALPPKKEGEPNGFTVWLRHKDGPVLLKSRKGDVQADLQWIWNVPDGWKWTALGPFSREQIGDGLLVIRGGEDATSPSLDALVLAPTQIRELPPQRPNSDLPALRLQPSVTWSQLSHPFRRELWGLNDYEILDPNAAEDEKFQGLLRDMEPPIVRIHNGALSDKWTDEGTRSWNRDKIVRGFKASTGYGNARIMLNIARPPGWLTQEQVLTVAEEDAWAAQMGDLARLIKAENIRVDYWELTNEMEGAYDKAKRLPDLWRLWNKCALAVKAADPAAKVGGPAFTWPQATWVNGFFEACGANVDFVTWHNYASGDIFDSNEQVLGKAQVIAGMAKGVVDAAKKYVPGRKIELFLTEFNVKWVWEPIERRHGNSIGALFQASVLNHIAPVGIDGVTVWHVKGNAYGLVASDNSLRSTGALYTWSKYLHGQVARSSTPDDKNLEVMPIVRPDGKKSLLILAKAGQSIEIPDVSQVLGRAKWTAQRIDADGLHEKVNVPARGAWKLPGYSLTLLMD